MISKLIKFIKFSLIVVVTLLVIIFSQPSHPPIQVPVQAQVKREWVGEVIPTFSLGGVNEPMGKMQPYLSVDGKLIFLNLTEKTQFIGFEIKNDYVTWEFGKSITYKVKGEKGQITRKSVVDGQDLMPEDMINVSSIELIKSPQIEAK